MIRNYLSSQPWKSVRLKLFNDNHKTLIFIQLYYLEINLAQLFPDLLETAKINIFMRIKL